MSNICSIMAKLAHGLRHYSNIAENTEYIG